MDFNLWKNYTPPAYLPSPILPLPMPKSRPNAYVIPHRQTPSPCLRKNTKFKLAPLPSPLNFRLTFEDFKQQQAEEARIAAEEARIAKEKVEAFSCRRCPAKFPSNTKLHDHVRTKHCKKPKEPSPPPPAAALAIPPASPPPTPIAPATPVAIPSAPASPITSPATPTTTPKKPISWSEIASRPMKPNAPSRLPRPTLQFDLPTPPPSPVMSPQKLTNHIQKRTAKTPYMTVHDLYIRFHEKPRPLSLTSMQNRLPAAPSSGLHQTRITTYFKPTSSRHGPKAPLVPNRKCADSQALAKSTWNRDLTLTRPYTTQGRSFTNSARFFCHHFDHSPTHGRKRFVVEPQHYRKARIV